jgi:RNA polymerase sigma-70 factor (ECF subfamily)
MGGGRQTFGSGRPVVYCLIPAPLAPALHEPLRRHFANDPSIEVIVELRVTERRSARARRAAPAVQPADSPPDDRRSILAPAGRRTGERRATQVPVPAPALPHQARRHADRLTFVERLEPSGLEAEDLDTARLVTRIQAGDHDAVAILYMRYFDRVYGYLRLLFRDVREAEDAAQHVFLKVLEGVGSWENRPRMFRPWLFVVARNHALNELKRAGHAVAVDSETLDRLRTTRDSSDELTALDWVSDRELSMFIERLPLTQRQILFLRYVVGLSSRETAIVLGHTLAAVRRQHVRAVAQLRDRLTALGREPKHGGRVRSKVLLRTQPVLRARRFSLL